MAPDSAPTSDGPLTHEIGKRSYVVADVDPLDVDGVRTVAVGTGIWLVAFIGLLPFYGRLREDDHLWWLWTCLAGFGLGLAGWDYCLRRRKHRLAQQGGPDDAGAPTEAPVVLPPVLDVPADPPLGTTQPPPATSPEALRPPKRPPFKPGPRDAS